MNKAIKVGEKLIELIKDISGLEIEEKVVVDPDFYGQKLYTITDLKGNKSQVYFHDGYWNLNSSAATYKLSEKGDTPLWIISRDQMTRCLIGCEIHFTEKRGAPIGNQNAKKDIKTSPLNNRIPTWLKNASTKAAHPEKLTTFIESALIEKLERDHPIILKKYKQ